MTTEQSELAVELQRLTQRWDAITEIPENPQSTMDIIEYGLGKQRRAELYVNRLLCYFLDPEKPHGMETDFLYTVLQQLPTGLEFDEDTYDLSDVRVNEQVIAKREGTATYPDLVVDVPGEWFILIELKFSAAETGTESYAKATQLGGEQVANYESGQYYLYLHQRNKPTASSCEFTNWTWESFVGNVLDEIIMESAPRYPQRTAAQLHELRDDLENITNMGDQQTAEEEKIELYLKHVDAITDVSSAFDEAWDAYSERWGERLAARLDRDSPDVRQQDGDTYPEVTVSRPDADAERWVLRDNGGDWQHIYKYGWYKHEEMLTNLVGRASDNNDLRIGYYHRMGKHRDDAVQGRQLHFKFRNMGSNPKQFKHIYSDQFNARENEISDLLSDTNGHLTGNKLTKIVATYPISVSDSTGFFDAYTEALREAFVDFVVENPELTRVLTETFDDAVEEYSQ